MPYIGKQLVRGQNRKLDDISSGFNGSQTTFTLQVASQNVTVGSALQLWISLGGVIQEPVTDFTIAGNQITFTTAPAASLDFFGVIQGDVTDTNTPGDATVTTSKLATGLTVNLADGSAATSSLQLGGTDSGLFSSAADKVNVTTGGVERLEIGDSEVVFNDPSNDVDFRVESNGNTHMLFVDGGNDRVGINESSPSASLHVTSGTTDVVADFESTDANAWIQIRDNSTTDTAVMVGAIGDDMRLRAGSNERVRIDSSGNVGIGTTSPSNNLDILSTTSGATVSARVGSTAASGVNNANLIINNGGTGNATLRFDYESSTNRASIGVPQSTQALFFTTAGSERARIDSSGRLLVGTSSAPTGGLPQFSRFTVSLNNDAASNGGQLNLAGDARGSLSIGDALGQLLFTDSTNGTYGSIQCQLDATPGNGDYPGRIVLATTADGAASPTERMRIDSSGNVGIGTTSPDGKLHVHSGSAGSVTANGNANNLVIENSDTGGISILTPDNGFGYIMWGSPTSNEGAILRYRDSDNIFSIGTEDTNGILQFRTGAGTEAMRITNGGDLLVNRTTRRSNEKFSVDNADNVAYFGCTTNSNVSSIQMVHAYAQGSQSATQIQFQNNTATTVGSIQSTGSATSFNTSSDYRLKENVVDLDGAITRVKQLSPKRFNFIADADTTVDGFLAHEAQTVVPEAVTGTHNEVDSDNNPVYQGIDQSKLVPLLTAALQEAIAKIETLETKVAALEAE